MAKAQGRGSAEWMVVGVLVAVHCCSVLASAATYTVGGSQGWTIGPNYTTWAAAQSYTTGDILFFPYSNGAHDVVVVDKAGYDACSATSAIATYTDGNTNVTLNTTGTHYFLCSLPGHCSAGMKLAVTVGAGATPAPAPSTTVGTPAPAPATSAPAPATTPASAPTPTSTAPVPSPATPSTAPVPSPASVGTPTSAPTPTSSAPPSPPSVGTPTPATVSTPPLSPAASLSSSASLAAALLCLSAALMAF